MQWLCGAPAESGVVGNVDVAGVGLAGGVEGVGRWAWEGQIGVVDAGVDLCWVGGIVLQQYTCLKIRA